MLPSCTQDTHEAEIDAMGLAKAEMKRSLRWWRPSIAFHCPGTL